MRQGSPVCPVAAQTWALESATPGGSPCRMHDAAACPSGHPERASTRLIIRRMSSVLSPHLVHGITDYWVITAVWKWLLMHETRGLHGSTGVAASLGQLRPQQLQHWHILRRHEIPKQGPGAELSRIAALVWVRLGRTSPVRLLLGHATWKWHWCGYMQETHGLLADLFSTECRFHWFMANFTLNPGWFLDMLVIGLSWNVS